MARGALQRAAGGGVIVVLAVASLPWVTLLGLKLAAIASVWLCRAVILGALVMGIGPVQLLRAALDRSLGG